MNQIVGSLAKYSLSSVQKKLYTHHQFYPEDPSYNLCYCYKIEGKIELKRFVRVWELVYGSGAVFKVHFEQDDAGVPFQVYDASRTVKVDVEYLQSMTVEESDQYVMDCTIKASQTCLDLRQWPITQLKVFYSEHVSYWTINIPHIIFDGYSSYHKFNEFSRIYNCEKSLDEIEAEADMHTSDLSYLEQVTEDQTAHNVDEQALAYFQKELEGLESLSIGQLEQNRDEAGRLEGQETSFDLSLGLSEQIRAYISNHHLTDFSFFLAAYAVLIHKLFSLDRVAIGIPLANRSKANKTTFGFYVNSLPMVADVQGSGTFQELCRSIKRKTISLIRYQNFDFLSQIHRVLPHKNYTGTTKFNTLFTYYLQKLSFDIDQCKVTQMPVPARYLNFPLNAAVQRLDDTYRVKIEYGAYLKQADLQSIYYAIIESIISTEDRRIADIQVMQAEEGQKLEEILRPGRSFPVSGTIHHAFMEQARKNPMHTAVQYGDVQWSYRELDERSNQIANYIIEHFPAEADKIVISFHRSPILIALILGVLKAGRAYVPVDPIMPAGRLAHILSDLNQPPCLTQADCLKLLNEARNVYVWERIESELAAMPKVLSTETSGAEQLAYMIYTSGSTGLPKGVMVTHGNVLRSFQASAHEFAFQEEDTWLWYHSYGFDPSVWEIFGALLYGGKVIVVDETMRKAPDEMYQLIVRERVTMLQMTPSAFQQLIGIVRRQERVAPLALRCILIGGETLRFAMLKEWIDRYGDQQPRLYNVYGPTETTILATYYRITRHEAIAVGESIIGRPLLDVELYVKNRYLDDLPSGVPGELYIGGYGVSKGYYNREDLTNERFLSGMPWQGTVYRTGDQVRLLSDGNLEFLERVDNQIQLRGYRIELGEIETALQQYPHCKSNVVAVHTFDGEDKRLVAYLVMEEGESLDEAEVRAFLRTKLPEYMIPSVWVEIPTIPVTVNGKVDYNALTVPPLAPSVSIPENGSLEQKIIAIWKQVLKTDHVGKDDNFFDIGGTSLLISDVYYKLADTLPIKQQLSMVELFQYTTPRVLAAFLHRLNDQGTRQTDNQQTGKRKEALLRRRKNGK